MEAFSLALALLGGVASLLVSASAGAAPSGNYAQFAQCPYKNPAASKCIYSTTSGGEVVLGSARVPIVNPVILQGAYAESANSDVAKFIAAANGDTLSRASQPVPGGLIGIVAPPGAPPLVKAVIALLFENGLTKASASLELARPADEIRFSEESFGGESGPALTLPVRAHLENPFLGPSCYVGSSSSPLLWKLTSGTTSPPKPNKPITGTAGEIEFLEGGGLVKTKGSKLVDNAWSAPLAHGCGGPLSFLVDPLVNSFAGLPARAGVNAVSLESAVAITPAALVGEHAGN